MKTSIFRPLMLLAFLVLARSAHSQRGPVAAGGDANGAAGTSSYSIGQIDFLHLSGASPSVMQGMQQPYETFLITASDIPTDHITAQVYPNPATESIILDIGAIGVRHLRYIIHDLHGRPIMQQAIKTSKTSISLAHFAQATYFLSVMRGDIVLRSFKIIKNH